MNLVLLEPHEIINGEAELSGRRFEHIRSVHRAVIGSELKVGVIGGKLGRGIVVRIEGSSLRLSICLESDPPAPLPLRLVMAVPRPKVLNRTIAAAVSMGVREIDLINSWRVEKSYWHSPKMAEENLRFQAVLGLEQSGNTILPTIRKHPLFVPFIRDELPHEVDGRLTLVADPRADAECPRSIRSPAILAIGPEGGFIQRELDTFRDIGFQSVNLGRRILRVETAMACLIGRLF
jgi:16S rRNA (uracil1498-N3)-methyltransferase